MEVEAEGGGEPPGEPVAEAGHSGGDRSELAQRPAGDRDGGDGDQGRLGQQQDLRGGPEPVERGEGGQGGREVVAQQVEAGALEFDDRASALGVAAHSLFEDPEVVSAGEQEFMTANGEE